MKQTLNVNIGSIAFTIDEDAYGALSRYLDDIRSRLTSDDAYLVDDVEARIADILSDKISSPIQVVSLEMVRSAMAVIGRPEVFGGKCNESSTDSTKTATPNSIPYRRLVRLRTDRMIGGVCSGLASYFNLDVTLVRVIALVAALCGTAGIWAYLILWICVPQEDYKLNSKIK